MRACCEAKTTSGNQIRELLLEFTIRDTSVSRIDYRYTLIATNGSGLNSEPADYPEQAPPGTEFSIDGENIEDVIFNIARIVRGGVLNNLRNRVEELVSDCAIGLTRISKAFIDSATIDTYNFSDGGSMTISRPATSGANRYLSTLDNCNLDGRIFNGEIDFPDSALGRFVTTRNFSSKFPDGNRAVVSAEDSVLEPVDVRSLQITSYQEFNAEGTRRPVNNYRTSVIVDLAPVRNFH